MLTALPLQTAIISPTELCWDRATEHWGGVIVGLRSAGASAYSLHSPHQLLYPDIQRRCQGDKRAQARIHRGTGVGLTLPKLLVGVGRDASSMGQGFLAEALSDAGALQPQTELAGDEILLFVNKKPDIRCLE